MRKKPALFAHRVRRRVPLIGKVEPFDAVRVTPRQEDTHDKRLQQTKPDFASGRTPFVDDDVDRHCRGDCDHCTGCDLLAAVGSGTCDSACRGDVDNDDACCTGDPAGHLDRTGNAACGRACSPGNAAGRRTGARSACSGSARTCNAAITRQRQRRSENEKPGLNAGLFLSPRLGGGSPFLPEGQDMIRRQRCHRQAARRGWRHPGDFVDLAAN